MGQATMHVIDMSWTGCPPARRSRHWTSELAENRATRGTRVRVPLPWRQVAKRLTRQDWSLGRWPLDDPGTEGRAGRIGNDPIVRTGRFAHAVSTLMTHCNYEPLGGVMVRAASRDETS